MKSVRAFVADDEPLALRRILRSLADHDDLDVVGSADNGLEALSAINALKPDLLVLDIMMPGLNGFELLKALDDDRVPAVIFVTAFDSFAVGAFNEGAVDYVLKPLDDERLAVAIARARQRLSEDANRERFDRLRKTITRMNTDFNRAIVSPYERDLWVKESGVIRRIRVEDVDWIEAAGDYVALHIGSDVHLADDSIRSLRERLDPDHFQQVHRSAIVRLLAVSTINRERFSNISLLMQSGDIVRVSKSFKRTVLERVQSS